jgi:membrane protease YdiL (CAAX protease family)
LRRAGLGGTRSLRGIDIGVLDPFDAVEAARKPSALPTILHLRRPGREIDGLSNGSRFIAWLHAHCMFSPAEGALLTMSSLRQPPAAQAGAITIPSAWSRLLASGAGHWLGALLLIGLPFVAINILTKLFLADAGMRDVSNAIKTIVLVASYWVYVQKWERRPVVELSGAGAASESLAGLLLGGLLFTAVVAVLAGLGVYSVLTAGSWDRMPAVVAAMLPKVAAGALMEELLFRLVLLRLLERSFGTTPALIASSLLFGLAHLGNPGATLWLCLGMAAEIGLLFGAAYLLTRRIWLCAAMHVGWNFAQGAIFSIAVSGQSGEGLLRGQLTGPGWLTGGVFGAEGSLVAVVVCLAASAVLLDRVRRRRSTRL